MPTNTEPESESSGSASSPFRRGRLIVASYDPGVTVGWAWHAASIDSLLRKGTRDILRELRADVELDTLHPEVASLDLGIHYGQFGGSFSSDDLRADRMMDNVRSCWVSFKVDPGGGDVFAVVTERFTLRQMGMDDSLLAPVRLNAKFERDLRGAGMVMHQQTPADAKTVCNDGRLRSWNVFDSKSGVHARDAQRHGILFLRRWASTPALRTSVGTGAPRKESVSRSA